MKYRPHRFFARRGWKAVPRKGGPLSLPRTVKDNSNLSSALAAAAPNVRCEPGSDPQPRSVLVKGFGCWPWRRSGQGAGPASESLQGRNPRGGVLWRGALWRFRHRGRECRAAARGSRARIRASAGEREGIGCGSHQPRRRVVIRARSQRAPSGLSAPRGTRLHNRTLQPQTRLRCPERPLKPPRARMNAMSGRQACLR